MKLYLLLSFLFLAFTGAAQVAFTAGNIVVYRVGTAGGATLSTAAFAVFLDEYTPAGALVQSVAMPVGVSGVHQILTATGNGNIEGALTRSTDGQYLVITGYNAAVATAGIAGTASATRSRTIGLVKYDATVNTTTSLTDLSSGNSVTSAVSTDGTALWACGTGTAAGTGGVRYAAVGATTSTRLNAAGTTMLRDLYIAGGQLFVSGTASSPRIGGVGTGMPTTAGQTITNLPALSTSITPGQFVFVDLDAGVAGLDVLYYADENAGILKYSLVAGSLVSNGTVGNTADDYRGLAATVSGTTVTLYATRKGANTAAIGGGEFVKLADASGYNGAFSGTPTVLATTTTDKTAFRGIALAPVLAVALPLKLITLTADKLNKDIRVNWSAASAINFSHFEIERSMNGILFTHAGRVDFRATNTNNADYNFTDAGIINTAVSNSKLYYRLKMVETDGHFDYSKTIAVTVNEKATGLIHAYPGHFTNQLFVKVELSRAGNLSLSLTDAGGKVVRSMQLSLPAGENTVTVSQLGHLQKGIYLLRVNINDKVSSIKLIK